MILCCGEALIDMIPNADGAFMAHAGGAVFNTSIGLGRQGVAVSLVSGVSTDLFGKVLEQSLQDSHVATTHLIRSDLPTTLAFVKLVDGKASYAFYDENTAGRMIQPADFPIIPDVTKAMFFGGISLAVEPCADSYLDLLMRYTGQKLTVVDPNIRPSFIADEPRYRARMSQVLKHADIIKISDEDLNWWDRSNRDINDKATAFLSDKTKWVCLTLGDKGVRSFRMKGEPIEVAAPRQTVIDTVGAGDAFNAGLLTMLDRKKALSANAISSLGDTDLKQVLSFATAFAADTVARAGSDPAWNFGQQSNARR
ncbi:MAG: carbohydrate kinase [Pseudomonadota bacterium]